MPEELALSLRLEHFRTPETSLVLFFTDTNTFCSTHELSYCVGDIGHTLL